MYDPTCLYICMTNRMTETRRLIVCLVLIYATSIDPFNVDNYGLSFKRCLPPNICYQVDSGPMLARYGQLSSSHQMLHIVVRYIHIMLQREINDLLVTGIEI